MNSHGETLVDLFVLEKDNSNQPETDGKQCKIQNTETQSVDLRPNFSGPDS